MEPNILPKIKWCPVCNQGWVQVLVEKQTNAIYLGCSECETEWRNPVEIIPALGTQGSFGQSRIATAEEVTRSGWAQYLI